MYGGAGGGGKSDALLMAALQYVDVPGYSAIIFRRTKTDLNLSGSILDRARSWWDGTAAKWDADLYGFRFPTRPGQPDATISFAYMAKDADRFRYKGAEFHYVAFDELTQFTALQYTYMFSRLRRLVDFGVPMRMRSATNPGDVGHDWVKARFVKQAREVAPDHFVSPPSKELLEVARELGIPKPEGATFIRSFARDNPGLDLADYRMKLARMTAIERRQMEHGDWDAVFGGEFFQPSWFKIIPAAPADVRRWIRYWDLAATKPSEQNPDPDWTAGAKVGLEVLDDGASRVVVSDVVHERDYPGEIERVVKATAQLDGRRVPIWIEEKPGSAGKNTTMNYARRVLLGYDVNGHRKTGPKEQFWKPLAAQAQAGNLALVEGPWNEAFISELSNLPNGKKDQADAAAGAFDRLVENDAGQRTRQLVGAM